MKELKINQLLHGADYNPEQWLEYPEIVEKDIELMKKAHCNVVSMGMFSWSMLEPEEGVYTLDWLEAVIDKLYENGIYTILSTPSGARPVWLAKKYEEVLRVGANRVRNLYGARHNHCYTSPIYREKVASINGELAKRLGHKEGVILWHLSNEYGGECHCELCQEAFREWLQKKYQTLEVLNKAWWTTFWSHKYTAWDQIESPAPHGEMLVHGQNLDWKRFVTDSTIDFMNYEKESVKKYTAHLPVTTNVMYYYEGLNYFKFKDMLDILSWDSYPVWHKHTKDDIDIAVDTAMFHDIIRSIKGEPFLLMESTPSMTNWQNVSKLKKPHMHMLSSIQAVAHGSDSVQYFQWRKSRGSSEKLHGSVVDHYGEADTRVFKEVAELGERLEELTQIKGSKIKSEVAILFDWENMWAVNDSQGPRNIGMHYKEAILAHYKAFWEMGIPVDFVDMDSDISRYKMFIAPMMYMTRSGIENKIREFVAQGGVFVTTYWSGVVNDTDLCHLGGTPYGLMDIVGLRSEEIDSLFDGETNSASASSEDVMGLKGMYTCSQLCDIVKCDGAQVLLTYNEDFYKGKPALTYNEFEKGIAYYICSQFDETFYKDFYKGLVERNKITKPFEGILAKGVTVTARKQEDRTYLFIQNFNTYSTKIESLGSRFEVVGKMAGLDETHELDAVSVLDKEYILQPYEVLVVKK